MAGGQSESVHSSAGERQADEEAAQQARLAAQAEAHKLAVEQQAKQRQAEAAQNKALAEAEAQAERGRAALERERENAAAEEARPAVSFFRVADWPSAHVCEHWIGYFCAADSGDQGGDC